MSGGTLAVNTLANDGSANVVLAGGTVQPLNTNAGWAANMVLSTAVTTFDTRDAGGQARTLTVSGTLSGDGGLNVAGNGVAELSGLNTYSGATTVSNATLQVNGALNANGAVSVYSGATFGGTGAVGHLTLFEGGTYSPGNSPGTQTVASLDFAGGTFKVELVDAGLADQVIAQTGLALSATLTNSLQLALANFDANTAAGTTFVIARNDSGLAWDGNTFYLADAGGANDGTALLNHALFGVLGGGTAEQYFQIQYDYTAADSDGLGNDITLTLTMIPEPGALSLGALALGGTYLLRRRVRGKNKHWNR